MLVRKLFKNKEWSLRSLEWSLDIKINFVVYRWLTTVDLDIHIHIYLYLLSVTIIQFQLRYLQTLNNISQENNSTIVFPVPIDIMSEMMRGPGDRQKVSPGPGRKLYTLLCFSLRCPPSQTRGTNKSEVFENIMHLICFTSLLFVDFIVLWCFWWLY